MSTFQERIKGFSELPSLKSQGEEVKLKLESLEKIKGSVSEENYLNLHTSNVDKLNDLNSRITVLQSGISDLLKEIELDSKVLESENTILSKELQELQFLSERGALGKQDYDVKRSSLQQKINRNRSLLGKNQSGQKELDFYATYIGPDSYLMHSYNQQVGSIKAKLSDSGSSLSGFLSKIPLLLKSKVFISITSILIILFIVVKVFGLGKIPSVKIGDQVWMTKNLDVDHYRNGDPIPQVQDITAWANLETGAWCYYENNPANGKIYGKLYNWHAVNDQRGLAPNGWHIPTNDEWKTMVKLLGGYMSAYEKLKSVTGWTENGNNNSGFTGLPGGFISSKFEGLGKVGYWWSSTEYDYNKHRAMYTSLVLSNNTGHVDNMSEVKEQGFSVRCIMDK